MNPTIDLHYPVCSLVQYVHPTRQVATLHASHPWCAIQGCLFHTHGRMDCKQADHRLLASFIPVEKDSGFVGISLGVYSFAITYLVRDPDRDGIADEVEVEKLVIVNDKRIDPHWLRGYRDTFGFGSNLSWCDGTKWDMLTGCA